MAIYPRGGQEAVDEISFIGALGRGMEVSSDRNASSGMPPPLQPKVPVL
jgi:hypothetical protein